MKCLLLLVTGWFLYLESIHLSPLKTLTQHRFENWLNDTRTPLRKGHRQAFPITISLASSINSFPGRWALTLEKKKSKRHVRLNALRILDLLQHNEVFTRFVEKPDEPEFLSFQIDSDSFTASAYVPRSSVQGNVKLQTMIRLLQLYATPQQESNVAVFPTENTTG